MIKMAAPAAKGGAKPAAKGAAPKKGGKKSSKLYTIYEKSGDGLKRKTKFCPKCGEGTFMGKHKDRYACGQCKYTEFIRN
jgi:small subunit ribosomal protein S27Ae